MISGSANQPIVIVDDDDLDAEQTIEALREGGIVRPIVRLNDGVEAIDYLRRLGEAGNQETPPAFMLLDLKMPRQDGLDVLRFRRGRVQLHHVPVIMFTSSAHERDIEDSADLGANAYVVKPVNPRAYGEAVKATGRFWCEYNRAVGQG